MYEGGLKVPTCFRWPNRIPPRQTLFRALTMDILPTLADLCGVSIGADLDGMSLKRELLAGDQAALDRTDPHTWLQGGSKHAMRSGDWKLVRDHHEAPFQLFNLADDPLEEVDLAAEQPARLKALRRSLQEHQLTASQVPWRRPGQSTPE